MSTNMTLEARLDRALKSADAHDAMARNPERVNGELLLAPIEEARDLSIALPTVKVADEILNSHRVNWTVSKVPLYLPTGAVMPGAFALVRDDNRVPLATVGSRYTVNQNTRGLAAFDALVKAGHLKGYSNAGIFGGGRLAWIQAEMARFSVGHPDDEHAGYLTLTISHGSRMTDRWNPSATRIVCRNTFMMSRSGNAGLRLGHTASGNAKFEDAVDRILRAAAALKEFKAQGDSLYARQMTSAQARAFAHELFPSHTDDVSGKLTGMRERVIDLFDNGQGQFMARGTRFAAWNAVTEYADHTRTTRRGASGDDAETSRLSSAWFGSGADLKDRALKLLLA